MELLDSLVSRRLCSSLCGSHLHAACIVEKHGQQLKGAVVW